MQLETIARQLYQVFRRELLDGFLNIIERHGSLSPRRAAAFERVFARVAERSPFPFQAFALVAPGLPVGTEARDIPLAGAAESFGPHLTRPQSRGPHSKPQPVTHAEKMTGVAAVRLLRAAGIQRNRQRE
jgi:hypothetical protein